MGRGKSVRREASPLFSSPLAAGRRTILKGLPSIKISRNQN
jgi:hypothetical protein